MEFGNSRLPLEGSLRKAAQSSRIGHTQVRWKRPISFESYTNEALESLYGPHDVWNRLTPPVDLSGPCSNPKNLRIKRRAGPSPKTKWAPPCKEQCYFEFWISFCSIQRSNSLARNRQSFPILAAGISLSRAIRLNVLWWMHKSFEA